MTEALWITVASLIISIATFVYAAVFKTEYSSKTGDLEMRLRLCEEECHKCRGDHARMVEREVILLRRINDLMDKAK